MLRPWGRSFAVAIAVLSSASPAIAQPEPEIEMEGDPPPDKPVDKPADKPADPPPAEPPPDGQPVAKDPKLAKKVAATAQQAVAKGDLLTRQKKLDEAKLSYEAAVTAYLKAIELGDDVNLHYDLGLTYDKLGKTDEAAKHWRTAKSAPGAKPDIVKKATAKFDEATTKIGLLTLNVKPDGATITLDNIELGRSPLPQPLLLMPGTYTFNLAADGHQLKDIEVKVEAGSESERGIDMEPIQVVIDTKPPIDDVPPPPPPKAPSKLPLLIGAGATGAFLLATTITGVMAVGKHGTFTAPETASFDRELAAFDGKNYARVSDVMFVATLGAAGFTAYWYFFKYRPAQKKFRGGGEVLPTRKSSDEPGAKVQVVPWVQPDAGGLTLGGRF
jgi:tetratricopeptide (TPR) repeat protein